MEVSRSEFNALLGRINLAEQRIENLQAENEKKAKPLTAADVARIKKEMDLLESQDGYKNMKKGDK